MDTNSPSLVGEVGFLEAVRTVDDAGGDDVGRIDMVLVNPQSSEPHLSWCALEMQSVYFSGDAMGADFGAIARYSGEDPPFPAGRRRPDYRSSGPKRLMPQLQTKVPTLRRWGKKMAVVVDRAFFDSLGPMDHVSDISNCDIAWFIVRFDDDSASGRARLVPDTVRYTTLERAVEGLTGGQPVTLPEFERRIMTKLGRAAATHPHGAP